ncbi:MAG: 6,7-dimethyl-8-ribityllumazine synthase [Thermoplasmata archaeon]|jgi:6,7-dimethyl-8-ribityllumazine synthase|nr:6,7-dimethyl-8-ribityllumazine synthase [Thermoplasmata archaeon]MEA3166350.1 6,7-dimethyl-8-ribityllumazine synthase [Thermoplasmata archaeon]
MALDEKTLERMLKAQKDALEKAKPTAKATAPAPAERTDLFEEYVRPAAPGEGPKPKGLNAAGYKFPPETPGTAPAMTKANMAKGLGLPPPVPPSKEPAPPTELVEKDTLFEEYHRPDLKEKPRTGKGIRAEAPGPKSAKEILKDYEPPVPQVHTPRRTPNPTPADHAPKGEDVEADAAHLDAEADLASAAALTMSHSKHHGPTKVQTDHDPFREMPKLPDEPAPEPVHAAPASPAVAAIPVSPPKPAPRPAPMPAPSFGPAARAASPSSHAPHPAPTPHVSDAPALRPGSGPRIALVQADFNHEITKRMADDAVAFARQLGATVVHHLHVAGAFDIPLTAKMLAVRADVDAVVAIGCIIQGETGHDELIAREVARKLADLAFMAEKPIGLAVTGPRMTKAQAEARVHVARHAVTAVTQQWRGLQALNASPALAH